MKRRKKTDDYHKQNARARVGIKEAARAYIALKNEAERLQEELGFLADAASEARRKAQDARTLLFALTRGYFGTIVVAGSIVRYSCELEIVAIPSDAEALGSVGPTP